VPLIQLSQHDGSSWKDGHPEDICLAESQAHKTEHEQTQMPPDLLGGILVRSLLVRTYQRVKAQHDRERRSDICVVERREEEQRRHESNIQRAVRSSKGTRAGLSTAAHALGEDLFDNPRQGDHTDDIGGSDSANVAAEDRLEDIGDQVEARWRCEFGIPGGEVVVAVSLCLRDVKDLVLREGGNEMRKGAPTIYICIYTFDSGQDIQDMAPGRSVLPDEPTMRAGCPGGCSCVQGSWP